MPNTIQLRRSATANAVPTTAQLALGELAINTTDGKLYLKKNVSGSESIVEIGSGGASISVSDTAPASPINGSLWWDTTVGQLKIYYTDGTSNQWVDAVNSTAFAPKATATSLGSVELFSDTVQTVAANAVTTTASRTYGVQLNAADQMVVNVPWSDTNSGGTVTSVGATGTVSGLTLSGTVNAGSVNLTLDGTLSVTASNFASQTANTILAAPNGAAGAPTFRTLVAADIPTLNQNTTGTSSNVTGTVAPGNGGTGQTTYTNGQLLIGNSTGNTLSKATLTPGYGITITNGSGTITIASSVGVQTIASAATITPNANTDSQVSVTALAVAAQIAIPSGNPSDGQRMMIRFKDNNTARALTWITTAGGYRAVGLTLPTTTTPTKVLYVGCIYNAFDGFWDVIAKGEQA